MCHEKIETKNDYAGEDGDNLPDKQISYPQNLFYNVCKQRVYDFL
jgi:hypothetical protein